MGSFDATTEVTIKASRDVVWTGLTDPRVIKQYMLGAQVETDWIVGHPITWTGEFNGTSYQDKGEVLACDRPSRLRVSHWSPLADVEDTPEHYHIVTYQLTEHGGTTRLTLTQSNNPTREAAEAMARDGWTPMLQTLKRVLEGDR